MRRRLVDKHVERAKVQLPEIRESIVDMLGPDQTLYHVIGDALGR